MRIKNFPSVESIDGSQDALVIEQTDGGVDKSRKVSPAQIKQYVLGDMDEVPTENSDNPVKSGGIFSTMGVPRIDPNTGVLYLEGGGAFGGNIDSTPTAGSNNAVASGGTKTYVDNAVATKRSLTVSSSIIGNAVNVASVTSTSPYTTPHEGFVRFDGPTCLCVNTYRMMKSSEAADYKGMWLPKGVSIYFTDGTPPLAQWFNCSNE